MLAFKDNKMIMIINNNSNNKLNYKGLFKVLYNVDVH